jgi:hypothetical protein
LKQKIRKKRFPWGVVEGLPGYWGEGQQLAMAIVTSALMRDHQNYVLGTARLDLTKDLQVLA